MSDKRAKYPWFVLELASLPKNEKDIKRAYAKCLKSIDQSTQIQEFQDLRAAYAQALWEHEYAISTDADDADTLKDEPFTQDQIESVSDLAAGELFDLPDNIPVAPTQLDNDQQHVNDLLAQINLSNIIETNADWLSHVLSDPVFFDLAYKSEAEHRLVEILKQTLVYDDGSDVPVFNTNVKKQTLQVIEDHFSWLDDYVGFSNRVWGGDGLAMAFSNRLVGYEEFVAPVTRVQTWWVYFKTPPSQWRFWIFSAICLLCFGAIVPSSRFPFGYLLLVPAIWVMVFSVCVCFTYSRILGLDLFYTVVGIVADFFKMDAKEKKKTLFSPFKPERLWVYFKTPPSYWEFWTTNPVLIVWFASIEPSNRFLFSYLLLVPSIWCGLFFCHWAATKVFRFCKHIWKFLTKK